MIDLCLIAGAVEEAVSVDCAWFARRGEEWAGGPEAGQQCLTAVPLKPGAGWGGSSGAGGGGGVGELEQQVLSLEEQQAVRGHSVIPTTT